MVKIKKILSLMCDDDNCISMIFCLPPFYFSTLDKISQNCKIPIGLQFFILIAYFFSDCIKKNKREIITRGAFKKTPGHQQFQ